ncbi:2Fe-2S iron-sulfur cluster-binding protein [Streptosporangium amethystogenes]|uniref:2Fe-2S iron-sulfur cluster-binding protein n=1 Tax=Streptosporangium amethystogenes TaxID=2002 RepID=UPI00068AD439|nr:2Fe-2S iron-sulfur cluster-binding protein [Streptosporangium amethystogenes]
MFRAAVVAGVWSFRPPACSGAWGCAFWYAARNTGPPPSAGRDGEPHSLQRAFSAEHALQCGFCTPGFLMLAVAAPESDPAIVDDPERLRELLTSNLCEPIRRAIESAAKAL